jgi:diguanylate cyclase (GGDEF) domain
MIYTTFPKRYTLCSEAAGRAEVIRRSIEEKTFSYREKDLSITLTIGVATISNNETIENLIKRAETALYEGKYTGKNKVTIAL